MLAPSFGCRSAIFLPSVRSKGWWFSSHWSVSCMVGLPSVKLIVMVKRGSSTLSAAVVTRSGMALGRTVEKTLALKADVSHL